MAGRISSVMSMAVVATEQRLRSFAPLTLLNIIIKNATSANKSKPLGMAVPTRVMSMVAHSFRGSAPAFVIGPPANLYSMSHPAVPSPTGPAAAPPARRLCGLRTSMKTKSRHHALCTDLVNSRPQCRPYFSWPGFVEPLNSSTASEQRAKTRPRARWLSACNAWTEFEITTPAVRNDGCGCPFHKSEVTERACGRRP